jgi:ribosomal-protein-alanine N-acetyltransferase
MAAQPEPDSVGALQWLTGGVHDCNAVAGLATHAFDPLYREAWNAAQMRHIVAGPDGWLELARLPSGPIIAFALNRQIFDEVELLLCAVHPGYRGHGIGHMLLDRVCAASRGHGARRLFLEVRRSNAAARQLYGSCGFSECGVRPGYYRTLHGELVDAITLARDI